MHQETERLRSFTGSLVFTFSMHGEKTFLFRKERSDLDIALEDGCEDDEFLTRLAIALKGLLEGETADFVFYLSGVDVLKVIVWANWHSVNSAAGSATAWCSVFARTMVCRYRSVWAAGIHRI